MAEMVSESASLITLISKDLKEFLSSNQVEIPNSLKQLQKVAHSEEFSESVIRVCQATTIGILSGCKTHTSMSEIQEVDGSCFLEKMIDKLMSTAGMEFSSTVVGSFARNLVLGFQAHKKSSSPTWTSHQVLTASKQSQKLGSVDYGKNGRIDLKNTGWLIVFHQHSQYQEIASLFLISVDVAVERGFEVVRYVGAKSSIILTCMMHDDAYLSRKLLKSQSSVMAAEIDGL
ncbi:protein PHLOEM PROTEIN 2-LIKE A10 [Sesamum angolense]|uniref:Protein PHLOEM PROTEIN 2-LIKE A10 n=1 Tax=Sesamum angolense TaxID=2727404 RepID=A0AAE1T3H5_9LAMI|nr:protein PHLOEM PROTEIN 2-LIKE A10 [Sesamum angolense]